MERVEIKSEQGQFLVVEYSPSTHGNIEDSEDLFCKPYYQNPLDPDLRDSKDFLTKTSDSVQSQDEKEKAVWLDKHCRLLIALYKEEHPNLGKTYELKTKRKLWQRIAERMQEQGSYFTPSQVEGKWKSFERSYNKKTVKYKTTCPYAKDLSEIFHERSPSPTFQLDQESTTGSENTKQKLSTDAAVSPTDAPSPIESESPLLEDEISLESFNEPQKRPKKSKTVVDELKKWREEFAKERKAKMEYRCAKLNAYRKRTILLDRQMRQKQKLLIAFMESQKKTI